MTGDGDPDASSLLIDEKDVELHELIDQGSTASVFRGHLHRPGMPPEGVACVVKRMTERRDSAVTTFERELRVLCQVAHPHIVKFYGIIDSDDEMQLCLEYCKGGCLYDLLYTKGRSIPLAWRQRLMMLYDIAHAIEYLHSFDPKLLHRDLKSLNVLLRDTITKSSDEPYIKVCDFGYTREFQTAMTLGAGTSHWMAPEVTKSQAYTEKADIFSFAMIIYELMCRRVPFADIDPGKVPSLIMSGVRPGLTMSTASGIRPEIPGGLSELMQECWAQDYEERPNFSMVKSKLEKIVHGMLDALARAAPEPILGGQCGL
jgi:serine/threonine protein kinase